MVCLGLAERDGRHLFNSVVLIDTTGEVLLRHRKVNVLSELMSPSYAAGTGASASVVDTRFGPIALLICADTFEDEVVAQVASRQPSLVLVPYGWASPANTWPDHGTSLHGWIKATARRCGAPVVGTDSTGKMLAGPWQGYVLGGQSAVSDASGQLLGVLADRRSEMRIVTVPLRRGGG